MTMKINRDKIDGVWYVLVYSTKKRARLWIM